MQTSKISVVDGVTPMTESERQKVDNQAELVLKQCESTIALLQSKLEEEDLSSTPPHIVDHRSQVLLHLLDNYADVSTSYYNQRSAHVENSLEARTSYTNHHEAALRDLRYSETRSASHASVNGKDREKDRSGAASPFTAAGSIASDENEFQLSADAASFLDDSSSRKGITVEEMGEIDVQLQEQLRRENLSFQTSLASMTDDIRQVEQQMVVISQAQKLIAHNLMQQRDDLEHIHKSTKEATNHIAKGNTELEKSAQSSSKFRVIILVLLLTMSFLLLLLHHLEP